MERLDQDAIALKLDAQAARKELDSATDEIQDLRLRDALLSSTICRIEVEEVEGLIYTAMADLHQAGGRTGSAGLGSSAVGGESGATPSGAGLGAAERTHLVVAVLGAVWTDIGNLNEASLWQLGDPLNQELSNVKTTFTTHMSQFVSLKWDMNAPDGRVQKVRGDFMKLRPKRMRRWWRWEEKSSAPS